MNETPVLRIGGVPEHFNLPWHLAIDQGLFAAQNLQVSWQDYPGGTGAMAKDLRNNTLDVAVLLTEGIVADIIRGNASKVIGLFVASPLIWGIHVPAASGLQEISQLQGKRYAISRMGSGSHLMAYVDAKQRGWQFREDQLVVVGDLQGAITAFREKKAEVFMWERFMTQPLVDSGEFRRVGERLTPWSCFVIAARNEVIEKQPESLQKLLTVIYGSTRDFMQHPDAVQLVAGRFGLKPEDAAAWFAHTRWATAPAIDPHVLETVADTLVALHLADTRVAPDALYQNIM